MVSTNTAPRPAFEHQVQLRREIVVPTICTASGWADFFLDSIGTGVVFTPNAVQTASIASYPQPIGRFNQNKPLHRTSWEE
jgi:hypothetical protein